MSVPGDPDTLGLTPDGSQLWIGQASLAYVTLLDTKTATVAGSLNLGGTHGPVRRRLRADRHRPHQDPDPRLVTPAVIGQAGMP